MQLTMYLRAALVDTLFIDLCMVVGVQNCVAYYKGNTEAYISWRTASMQRYIVFMNLGMIIKVQICGHACKKKQRAL